MQNIPTEKLLELSILKDSLEFECAVDGHSYPAMQCTNEME